VVQEEGPEAAAANKLETSDPDDEDKEHVPQAEVPTQWVTATKRYDQSSRLPSRYRKEMNAVVITGLASKNYYMMLYEQEEDKDDPAELACV